MVCVEDVKNALEELAPERFKMSWDNVGLLCGRKGSEVRRILVALDPFPEVCREAKTVGAQLLVTHHPLIFHPCKNVSDVTPEGEALLFLAENGIAAINAHTNLDVASGGVNDCLAAALQLEGVYSKDQTDVPGLLRFGYLGESMNPDAFARHVKTVLSCAGLRYMPGGKNAHKIAVGGGACASDLYEVISEGCDTFVTADVKYNQFEEAREQGINLIDAGHFETEYPVVRMLCRYLTLRFPEIDVIETKTNRDPVIYL